MPFAAAPPVWGPEGIEPADLNERTRPGQMHERGIRAPAVEQRLADQRGALLPGVEGEGKALVGDDTVGTAGHELSAPGLPTLAQVGNGDLHLHVREIFPVR